MFFDGFCREVTLTLGVSDVEVSLHPSLVNGSSDLCLVNGTFCAFFPPKHGATYCSYFGVQQDFVPVLIGDIW